MNDSIEPDQGSVVEQGYCHDIFMFSLASTKQIQIYDFFLSLVFVLNKLQQVSNGPPKGVKSKPNAPVAAVKKQILRANAAF